MKLAHVALWTVDLDAAASFWENVFGAEVGELYRSARRPGFTSRFVHLPKDGAAIELMTAPWIEAVPDREVTGWDHIAISVCSEREVDELAQRCREIGILSSDPRWTGDGFYEAVIVTPDGSRVEITS